MISYDRHVAAKLPLRLVTEAEKTGKKVVHFVCLEEDAEGDERTGIEFYAIADSVPRKGDWIRLEDGTPCQIVRSVFQVETRRNKKGRGLAIYLHRIVLAMRIGQTEERQAV
jgi:hypothetical protein